MKTILSVTLAAVIGFAAGVSFSSRTTPAPQVVVAAAPASKPAANTDIFLQAIDQAQSVDDKIRAGAVPLDQGVKDLEKDADKMSLLATTDATDAFQLAPDDYTHRRALLRSSFAGWVSVIEIEKQIRLASGGKLDVQATAAIKAAQDNASKVQTYIEDDTLPE